VAYPISKDTSHNYEVYNQDLITGHKGRHGGIDWCLWLCDHGWLIKVGSPHGVQLNVKGILHSPTDFYKNEWQ